MFSERSMSGHDPTGPLLAIHSLVVADGYRHRGVGSALLKNYLMYLSKLDLKYDLRKVVLMAKKDQLTFYVKEGGFHVMRESQVVHGKDVWFECERELGDDGTRWARRERKSECWIVDSFAVVGAGGCSGMGAKGTGNPAAVVRVPAVLKLEPEVVEGGRECGEGKEGLDRSLTPMVVVGDAFYVPPKPDRTISQSSSIGSGSNTSVDNNFLQNPDHPDTISWMKTVAQEFHLSETAFIWEHAPRTPDYSQPVSDGGEAGRQSPPQQPQLLHQHFHGTLTAPEESCPHYTIRFYTRDGSQVNLCGHATLAASAVVFRNLSIRGIRPADMSVVFHAKNGVVLGARPSLTVKSPSSSNGSGAGNKAMKITMDFPWKDLVRYAEGSKERESVMTMLRDGFFAGQGGDTPTDGKKSDNGTTDDRLELLDEDVLCVGADEEGEDIMVELTPAGFFKIPKRMGVINFRSMTDFTGYTRGVILCCAVDEFSRRRQEEQSLSHPSGKKGGGGGGVTADFLSRFFGPKVGIEEDPVTGSAHCILGPYFAKKLGRKTVVGKQKSKRGGIVECTPQTVSELEISPPNAEGEGERKMVSISGTAMMVMSGTLYV